LASNTVQISSQSDRNYYYTISLRWFNDFSKVLLSYGVDKDALKRYDSAFKFVLKLCSNSNRRVSFLKQFSIITSDFNDVVVIFLQTEAKEPEENTVQDLGSEALSLLAKIPDKRVNEYLQEALGCWKNGFLKGATILLWCAAIDRIHKVIEQIGFDVFNKTSAQMKAENLGRFKKFSKEFAINSISELRSTVFDSDLLWVLEGMQLIDANERIRLASCFDMRCHSGHPGDAPITKYNVLSCFSDIVEIILANPKFQLQSVEIENV
jgi:hypothetical protein